MNELRLEEINNLIASTDFYELRNKGFMPPFESMDISKSDNICYPDEQNEVRKRIIKNRPPIGYEIKEDEYLTYCVCKFLIYEKIPQDEKNIVCEYLDEELKIRVFSMFLNTKIKPLFKIAPDDISGNIYYSPRVNKVPLRACQKDPSGKVHTSKIEITYKDVEKFLLQKENNNDTGFLLAIRHLLNESGVLNEKWCPKTIQNLINNLNTQSWTECEEKLCSTNDNLLREELEQIEDVHHEVHVNDSLKNSVLNSVPKEFNTLEKALYIYSKLCQILSYDSMYYLGKKEQHDKSVTNISNVNTENNNIVCYEFSYILADLLSEIGITKIKESKLNGNKFYDNHANISFLVDGLVISADSTRTVIQGDLTSLKYTSVMNGIRCEQYDENSQKIFALAKKKVRNHLKEENKQYASMIPSKEYVANMSLNEKLILFNNLLTSCKLTNVDFIAYVNKLVSELELNITTKLLYDDKTNIFYAQINIQNYHNEGIMSYIIDSTTKKIYENPNGLLLYKEDITTRQ